MHKFAEEILKRFDKRSLFSEEGILITHERDLAGNEVHVSEDHARMQKIVTVAVPWDFDIPAFKAAIAGVKSGEYKKDSMEKLPVIDILDHLVKRTSENEQR